MTKIDLVVRQLHRAELKSATALRSVSARHSAEHEVCHVGADLAVWSDGHAHKISRAAADLGIVLRGDHGAIATAAQSVFNRVQSVLGSSIAARPEPGLLLLVDLRRLYLRAAGLSALWEVLAQGAQATRQQELVDLAAACHPDTLRQMRWANGMLKTLAPQIIAS